ncbi:MAG TPA: class I SAM-dependent methyltransferase [Desulfobacteraceae bacterium]|nr:class I SAM-dependent methyltransferase [Desulfobacteraceae bacterium]HDO31181.1 class I SAM-dependent methyltransferase [Desulfobacteraceae bacterium]
MQESQYLMESNEESHRLDIKINSALIEKQALWAGIQPGMRVADMGCGPGRITSILSHLVQPLGSVVGVDGSPQRLDYAASHYGREGIEFVQRDITKPLHDLGGFDFIWVRFVLEYYLSKSFEIVKNISECLEPGGILCLMDLDHNPLNYYGTSDRLDRTFRKIISELQGKIDFDPYAGKKLYSFLYDLGYEDIDVEVSIHKVIFGQIDDLDSFNMMKKIEVAPQKISFQYDEYEGGYEEFYKEAQSFFSDKRRFTYTPLISCRGKKPS